jgi:hypothetical protein
LLVVVYAVSLRVGLPNGGHLEGAVAVSFW